MSDISNNNKNKNEVKNKNKRNENNNNRKSNKHHNGNNKVTVWSKSRLVIRRVIEILRRTRTIIMVRTFDTGSTMFSGASRTAWVCRVWAFLSSSGNCQLARLLRDRERCPRSRMTWMRGTRRSRSSRRLGGE